jgi:DNA-binding MarR family transcriptional regulator
MAQIVKDLEEAGFVTRRPDPHDGRRSFVELSEAGLEALRTVRAVREDWLMCALESELDGREREQLREALALLVRVADA